jgi:protease I
MAEKNLDGFRVAILATDLFEEVELTQPRKALEQAGAKTVVISPKEGEIQGVKHDKKTKKVKVDQVLDQADPNEFDAVLLPGGAMNADAIRIEPKAQEFVRQIDQAGKPVAVICHAPWLLISARLTNGRRMTSYKTIQDDVRNSGAEWTDEATVRDRNWVSSRQPTDIPSFSQEMIALFSQGSAQKAA